MASSAERQAIGAGLDSLSRQGVRWLTNKRYSDLIAARQAQPQEGTTYASTLVSARISQEVAQDVNSSLTLEVLENPAQWHLRFAAAMLEGVPLKAVWFASLRFKTLNLLRTHDVSRRHNEDLCSESLLADLLEVRQEGLGSIAWTETIEALRSRLTKGQRKALYCLLAGFSQHETAKMTGQSRSTIARQAAVIKQEIYNLLDDVNLDANRLEQVKEYISTHVNKGGSKRYPASRWPRVWPSSRIRPARVHFVQEQRQDEYKAPKPKQAPIRLPSPCITASFASERAERKGRRWQEESATCRTCIHQVFGRKILRKRKIVPML